MDGASRVSRYKSNAEAMARKCARVQEYDVRASACAGVGCGAHLQRLKSSSVIAEMVGDGYRGYQTARSDTADASLS